MPFTFLSSHFRTSGSVGLASKQTSIGAPGRLKVSGLWVQGCRVRISGVEVRGGVESLENSSRGIWGFPKIRGTLLGVPIIRTIVFWGLYSGPPFL